MIVSKFKERIVPTIRISVNGCSGLKVLNDQSFEGWSTAKVIRANNHAETGVILDYAEYQVSFDQTPTVEFAFAEFSLMDLDNYAFYTDFS